MSKSYPVVEIKCNECQKVLTVNIRDQVDKKTDKFYIEPNYQGWAIRDGNHTQDYCKECNEKFKGD